jgi:hypothetical protein
MLRTGALRCVGAALAAASLSTGCGGSSPPGPTSSPAASSAPGPVEACLALANAGRTRRPDEPTEVSVAHLLVQHVGSKRPREGIDRSREQACLRALEARDAVRGGLSFEDAVARYSDEAGASTRGGKLGAVGRADLVAPFADAAFELDRGQLSDVVETEHGFHVILRTD